MNSVALALVPVARGPALSEPRGHVFCAGSYPLGSVAIHGRNRRAKNQKTKPHKELDGPLKWLRAAQPAARARPTPPRLDQQQRGKLAQQHARRDKQERVNCRDRTMP